jgi:N-acyl-D-aspartate/D-glutamate deacylase
MCYGHRESFQEEEMTASYDLVIRGGTIVDGTGRPGFSGDLAIKDGRIAAVGKIERAAKEEIDASGRIVAPGFVDVHTHLDGHATWANQLNPSSQHGVTTVLMGNCGVGFAPCKPEDRHRLVHLMEGVEDIPEIVMTEGLPWNWRSFPDYLDRLDERQYDMDVAAQLPHAPLRVFVMGERAAAREPATPEDIAQMRELAKEAIEAGALGFSTSRSINHKATDGTLTPTYGTASDELAGIAKGLGEAGKGVLQIISDWDDVDSEFAVLKRMVKESGRPLATTVLQMHSAPDRWRKVLDRIEGAAAEGLPIKAQVAGRPQGVVMGLKLGRNPFMWTQGYKEIEHLPFEEKLAALKDPARRERILSEVLPEGVDWIIRMFATSWDVMFEYDGNYEPKPEQTIAARAKAAGVSPSEFAYDLLVSNDGDGIINMAAANFHQYSADAMKTMVNHANTIWALGDSGAHCGLLCDASLPTYMLQRWAEPNGGPLPIERVIKGLSSETAASVGLNDRGILAPGYRADVNIIDITKIRVGRPQMRADLPNGGRQLSQTATGYDATIVNGVVTYRKGEPTGALPGRLVRGAQPAPVAA